MTVEESDSPIRNATRRAAGSGWSMNPPETELTREILVLHLAIDSAFWQALAKAVGWPDWERNRRNFIDYLADGGDAASFFAHLLSSAPAATSAGGTAIQEKNRPRKRKPHS
jgi:hypothetical protein